MKQTHNKVIVLKELMECAESTGCYFKILHVLI